MASVFVLGTGRTGTRYICRLFRENGYLVGHELGHHLDKACQHHLDAPLDDTDFLDTEERDEVFLEANHTIYSFAPQLADLFPDARFIHLHRDARDYVRSIMSHKLYTVHNAWTPDQDTTPAPPYAWEAPAFYRACLAWELRNHRVRADLRDLEHRDLPGFDHGRTLSIKSSDLWSGDAVPDIEAFLDVDLEIPKREEFGGRDEYTFPEYDDWPEHYRNVFWSRCRGLMEALGHVEEVPQDAR